MAGRARRILRKTLRWTLRIVLTLITVVLAIAVLLLYSSGFLHVVLNLALGFYNARIPGEITIGRVDGRLADHLVLGDVYLEDGDGRVLVAARELTIDWTPWDLLHGGVTIHRVALDGAQVHLVTGGWGDLAMPGPEKPPRETVAPSLPIDLWVGSIDIKDVDLLKDSGESIVGDARLAARDLSWSGLVAHLKIDDGAAQLPGVHLEALALTADYGEPRLQVSGLVTTELGSVELVRVDFDAETLTGDVLLAVDGRREALANRLGGPVAEKLRNADGDPTVRIDARGDFGDLKVGVHANLPGLAMLDLAASGTPFGAPRLHLRGRAEADLEAVLPPPHGAKLGVVRPSFDARLTGSDWSDLALELRLNCGECGAASRLDLHALATRDSVLSDSSAYVRLSGAGVALSAQVHAGPNGPEAGAWDLRAPDVAEPLGVARLFAEKLPPVAGGITTRGSCTGAPLRCEGDLEVERFIGFDVHLDTLRAHLHGEPLAVIPTAHAELSARGLRVPGYRFAGAEISAEVGKSELVPADTDHPDGVLEAGVKAEAWVSQRDRGDRASVAARVLPGPPLVVLLDALDVRMRGLQALLPRPARIEIAGRRIDVAHLGLLAAGGEIGVNGRADLDGRSDLEARIDRVKLAPLAALVPSLRGQVGGTINARASLKGEASRPDISLVLGGQKLRYRDGVLGDLDLGVSVGKGKASAVLGLATRMAENVTASAELPVELDLSRGKFAVRPGGLHLALDVKQLRLASLGPWLKMDKARGLVDAEIRVDGNAAKPDVHAVVRGRGLVFSTEPPASLDVELNQKSGGDITALVDVERLGGRLRVNVMKLPARIDLLHGGLDWRPEEEHDVTIVARDIDLWRQLNAIDPGHVYAGRLEVEGRLQGPMTDPDLNLAVLGSGLRVRDGVLGKLRLDLRLHDQRATADLDVNGSVARLVRLHAEVPLHVELARGKFAWLKDQPHVVDTRIEGFNLAGLKQLGVTAEWAGFVAVDAKLRGTASAPELDLHTDLLEIVWKERRVGTVHADVDYAKSQVKVGVKAQLGNGTLALKASAPMTADIGRNSYVWDRNGQHDIELRVDELDRTMLAPLGRVPEEALIELSLLARAKGNLADFKADLQAHGQMGHKLIGGAPLHITAEVNPQTQWLKFSLGPHKWAGQLGVRVDARADILGLVRGHAKAADIPFTAALRAPKFDSRFGQAFVPKTLYDINGELSASIDASGKLGAPDVRGELHLTRGSITVLQLQQRIRKIELDVKAAGRTITVEKLTAESGKGTLKGDAKLELPRGGGMKLASQVTLSKFPLVRPGLPQMQISTHVNADMVSTADETDVNLKIKGTKVYVTGYTVDPPKQIPINNSISFKDNKLRVAVASDEGPDGEVSAENEAVKPKKKDEAKAGKKFAMRIKLLDPIDIRGPATEMTWQGAVAASRDGDNREVTGKLTAKAGRLDLLGNRFRIESGEVTLPEDEDTIDPFIHVVARTSTSTAEVTATFRGRLTRPELIFSSEPSMTQSQILTLLLTGSPDANEADEERVLAQAAALLATFQNPQLSAFLSSRLGIDHVGLSFGDDVNQPILSVGKRLTKRIYVETAYKVNAPRRQNKVEARVEYQFAPRWTIETFFGDAAVGGLDVFWRKVFGKPKQLPENRGKPVPKGTGASEEPRGAVTTDAPMTDTKGK